MRPAKPMLVFILFTISSCVFTVASLASSYSHPDSLELLLPQPITADLNNELDPSISPDGKWLLYASNRNGNYDIWVRKIYGGIPVALTTHPADDYSPAWSPNGKKICFISTRDDPHGDMYVLTLSGRKADPQTLHIKSVFHDPAPQNFLSFSKNGKYIVYQQDVGSEASIKLLDISRRLSRTITPEGYLQPTLSPANDHIICVKVPPHGNSADICIIDPQDFKNPEPVFYDVYNGAFPASMPAWAPDGESFCAVLINQDSNLDGRLTPDDGQILYRFDLADSTYSSRMISLGDAVDSHPFWARDEFIYHTSDRHGNPDLWRIPAEGPVPLAPTATLALSFANSIGAEAELTERPLTEQEVLAKLLALDRVRSDFLSQCQIGANSMLETARLLSQSGNSPKAISYLKRIPRIYSEQEPAILEARLEFQLLVHEGQFLPDGKFTCQNPTSFIANLNSIFNISTQYKDLSARILFLTAATYEHIGSVHQALEIYHNIMENYHDAGDYPAEALLRIAAIYLTLGSRDEALNTYYREIREFPDLIAPTEKAIERVIELQVSSDDPLANLQDLIVRYKSLPALAAAAQKRIADIFATEKEFEIALQEWARIRGYALRHPVPFIRSLLAEALISMSEVENLLGEHLQAQAHLTEVEETFKDIKGGYYSRRARFLRLNMLLERAESLSSQGDWELAEVNFEKALELDPQNVRLHRGRIETARALNKLSETTREYRYLLEQRPEDPVRNYALGLCLSYSGEENSDDLQESIHLIQFAITADPYLTYGYLTQSFNYELIETKVRQTKKEPISFFLRTVTGIGTILNNLGRLITFSKELPPFQGYEKAIEILQLGLAVNDESTHPRLEAMMLLNLTNNYFKLGEFGYPRALSAFLEKQKYDSTFASPLQEATVREQIGQAAAIVGQNELALDNYTRALSIYHNIKQHENELRIILRLAELHQVIGDQEESNSFYRQALNLADREGLEVSPTKWWENMAFNALNQGDDDEAARLASKALQALPKIEEIPPPV